MKKSILFGVLVLAVSMGSALVGCKPQPAGPSGTTSEASDDLTAKCQEIDAMGQIGNADAVPKLTEMLKDETAEIRAHAAYALGKIGSAAEAAVGDLVGLLGDEDERVRRAAVRAIRTIDPPKEQIRPKLLEALKSSDPAVQVNIVAALASEGKDAVGPAIDALKDDNARYWACLLLAEIGPDAAEAVPALVEVAQNEDCLPDVRREALLAIAAIGPAAEAAVPALTENLSGDHETTLFSSAFALGSIGPAAKPAQESLEKLAGGDKPFVKAISVWALAKINPDDEATMRQAVEQLAEALTSDNQRLRAAAARGLIDLNPDPAISEPIMQGILENASEEVIGEVIDAISSVGEKAVPRLIVAMQKDWARPKVAIILGRIGPAAKDAVPALTEALADDDPAARGEILFALGEIGPDSKTAVPEVVKALADDDVDIRYGACFALGNIGPDAIEAKPALVKELDGDDEFLPLAAAWALAKIDPACTETAPKSVPMLIKALDEPGLPVRIGALEALAQLGPLAKDAVPAVKKATEDEDEVVREEAAKTLKAIE